MLTKLRDFWSISNQTHMVREAAAQPETGRAAEAVAAEASHAHPAALLPPTLLIRASRRRRAATLTW